MTLSEKEADVFLALFARHPGLAAVKSQISAAYELLVSGNAQGGTILTCGNGGSAADAEHIVAELMKSFEQPRPLHRETAERIQKQCPADEAGLLITSLQAPIRAISLVGHPALASAYANDCNAEFGIAQQLLGLGRTGDLLVAISTSGNAKNVLHAVQLARALGIVVLGLSGQSGGRLAPLCNACICVPAEKPADVQEYHLPVLHALCKALETRLFG